MYEQAVPALISLLSPEMFPLTSLYGDASSLTSLRALGMHSTISCQGLLTVAALIESDLNKFLAEQHQYLQALDRQKQQQQRQQQPSSSASSSSASAASVGVDSARAAMLLSEATLLQAQRRGRDLLSYLDANIADLLSEIDPAGLGAFRRLQQQQQQPQHGDKSTALANNASNIPVATALPVKVSAANAHVTAAAVPSDSSEPASANASFQRQLLNFVLGGTH